jgi:CubicO group peptidase (beta-lactamase class C family)
MFASCTFLKIIWYNFSGIEDYAIFPHRKLNAAKSPFHFAYHFDNARLPVNVRAGGYEDLSLHELLQSNGTVAFLIVKNDTIIFEQYYEGYADSSMSLSFSMAKSFLSILIGCAIDDGYIRSVEQPVTDYVPELTRNGFGKVRIKHLLQMTSGMDYTESDNPFGIHVQFYYASDLENKLLELCLKNEPGTEFEYKSGDNQLLGMILSRALKPKTITAYMQEKIWDPLGMEYDGLWSIDHDPDGLEKTFCCIGARARDFAKIGRLYLSKGNWNGQQILSKSWIEQSTRIDTSEGSAWNYRYQWWRVTKEHGDYMASGHLGQYLYIRPDRQLIIVRLGKSRGTFDSKAWQELFIYLGDALH